MNRRIGGGMTRNTKDPLLVVKVLEFKAECGVDEDVRVEDLTKAQHLKLKEREAKAALDEAHAQSEEARDRYAVAYASWMGAHKAWLEANEEEINADRG